MAKVFQNPYQQSANRPLPNRFGFTANTPLGGGAPPTQVAGMQTVRPAAPAGGVSGTIEPLNIGLENAKAMAEYGEANLGKNLPKGWSDVEGAGYALATTTKSILAGRLAAKKEETAKRMAENLVKMGFSPEDAQVMSIDKITRQSKMQEWQDSKKAERSWDRAKERMQLEYDLRARNQSLKAEQKRMGAGAQFMFSDALNREVQVEYYKDPDGQIAFKPAGLDRGKEIPDLRVLSPAEEKKRQEYMKIAGKEEAEAQRDLYVAMGQAVMIKQGLDALDDPEIRDYIGRGMWNENIEPVTEGGKRARQAFKKISGGVFLQGFAMLKGGGAITEAEGQAAREALTTITQGQSYASIMEARADLLELISVGLVRARAAAGDKEAQRKMMAPRSEGGLGLTEQELKNEVMMVRARAAAEREKRRQTREDPSTKTEQGQVRLPGGAKIENTSPVENRVRME